MKSTLLILVGSVLGAVIYVSTSYKLQPQDSGSYISYPNTIGIAAAISIVGAFIFWGFFQVFEVKSENTALIIGISAASQVLSWVSTLIFPEFGILTFAIAILVFSALGNLWLSRTSNV
jgi:hypothetical protein